MEAHQSSIPQSSKPTRSLPSLEWPLNGCASPLMQKGPANALALALAPAPAGPGLEPHISRYSQSVVGVAVYF